MLVRDELVFRCCNPKFWTGHPGLDVLMGLNEYVLIVS